MAEQMADEFAGFATMDHDRQVMLMNKHIRKITVTKVEVNDDVKLHFDVKTGMPEMAHQPSSFLKDAPAKPPAPPSGKGPVGVRLDERTGTNGGVPGLPEKRSNHGARSTPSS